MLINVKSLSRTPETDIILYISNTSIKKEKEGTSSEAVRKPRLDVQDVEKRQEGQQSMKRGTRDSWMIQ